MNHSTHIRAAALTALVPALLLALGPDRPHAWASGRLASPVRTENVQASSRQWSWPMTPRPPVVRGFERPQTAWGPGHRGVDLAARGGQPVIAVGSGTVAFAGAVAGRGVVSLDHRFGGRVLRTTYEPVAASVATGDRVSGGQRIGALEDRPGHCGVQLRCLHWGLISAGRYLDPLGLLHTGTVRLLPVWSVPAPYGADWSGVPRQPG
ncbi:MAG: murein hydrolase activator EnvC family protein [Carbonactinosporaceae bacterium]